MKRPSLKKPTGPRPKLTVTSDTIVVKATQHWAEAFYKPEYAKQAKKLCALNGATDTDLASFFEVQVSTIFNWKAKHPDFLQACKLGKDICNERMEQSLYHRGMGYTYDSEKVFYDKERGTVIRVPIREHVPPDVGAITRWLTNRAPERWREKVDVDLRVAGQVEHVHLNMTPQQAMEAYMSSLRVIEEKPKENAEKDKEEIKWIGRGRYMKKPVED